MMRCRLLILIAVLAIPLSLIAGPAVQAASAQGVSTAVVTPASGLAGSTVTGSGSNWTAGDHIQAYWSDNNSTLGGEVVVAPDGTFTDPGLKIPTGVASGPHQILFSDVEGRYFETASFDVTGTSSTPPPSSCSAPSVSLTPSAGPVGSQFVMKGVGWISGGVVHITLPNGSKGIFGAADATPTVSAGGAWQTTVTVGKSPAGSYTFTFAETGCTSQTGTFQVTASPPPPTCPPAPHPNLDPSTTTGSVGSHFSVTGSGWYPNDTVAIHLPYGSPGLFGFARITWPANSSGDWRVNITVEKPTPPGTYELIFSQSACGGLQKTLNFTVTGSATWAYDAGSYAGRSGTVRVNTSLHEPNIKADANFCGPGASQVLISAWTNKVPKIETLAIQESTNVPNPGTLMKNMQGPINKDIGTDYYTDLESGSSSRGAFSNLIGRDILSGHPLITGIMTGVGNTFLNGWDYSGFKVTHIVTIYGFDFTSPAHGEIYYVETSGTVAGTNETGPQEIDYQTFWTLVQANNVQLANAP